jgi:hypothetical protein
LVPVGTNPPLEHLCSVCDPAKKYFSYPSLVIYFFVTTHKTKTGTADRWENTNSNTPGPINSKC